MQGKIICKSVACDVWRAFNFTTTNVRAKYAHKIAKNTSVKYVYSTCVQVSTFFFLEKREK